MGVFSNNDLQAIIRRALDANIHRAPRPILLSGIDRSYVDLLNSDDNGANQLRLDVIAMNDDGWLGKDHFPLATWLFNVKSLLGGRPKDQRFFDRTYDSAKRWEQEQEAADSDPRAASIAPPVAGVREPSPEGAALDTRLERITFKNDMLPFSFLKGALDVAASVCRIQVTRYDGEQPASFGNGLPIVSGGTGWLIGKRHIITNHHVINARGDMEPPAETGDFERQALGATIQFGYDSEGPAPPAITVTKLCCADPVLDFAILELQAESGLAPLRMSTAAFPEGSSDEGRFAEDDRFAVNIIQHPKGAAKQIAIRNNLAFAIDGTVLSYMTDTDKGSSGSPVCDDRWRVVALHRAATREQGSFEYQGKTTMWINVGTPIVAIIDRLQSEKDASGTPYWDVIGGEVVA